MKGSWKPKQIYWFSFRCRILEIVNLHDTSTMLRCENTTDWITCESVEYEGQQWITWNNPMRWFSAIMPSRVGRYEVREMGKMVEGVGWLKFNYWGKNTCSFTWYLKKKLKIISKPVITCEIKSMVCLHFLLCFINYYIHILTLSTFYTCTVLR